MNNSLKQTRLSSVLSLLTSSSTLVCCALPALLVTLGAGAALSSVVSIFPQIVWLSEHKPLVFGLATFALIISGIMQWRARYLPCPVDPVLRQACLTMRRRSLVIYGISVAMLAIGAWFAFVAVWILG
jgi:hypothetical protein